MRFTLRLLTTLIVAALWLHESSPISARAAEQPDAPLPEITAKQLAANMREAIDRYTATYLEAEFAEERNVRAVTGDGRGEPEIVKWSGSIRYANDGRRWRAELKSKWISFTAGQPGGQPRARLSPRHEMAGFDGERHFTSDHLGGWIFGQENLELARQGPADLFWISMWPRELLLATLVDPRTSVVGQELRGGFRCYVAEIATPDGKWRQKIVISPRQSQLAVRVEQFLGETLAWSHELNDLKPNESGLWYLGRIVLDSRTVNDQGISAPDTRREIRVTRFDAERSFADDYFQFRPPYGVPVCDYTTGKSWFNDPWWPDVAPVLAKHDWPQPDLTPLAELASQPVPELEGQPAPAVTAARWINSQPIEWKQLKGQVTVVHFFSGRLVEPARLAALRRMHELYFAAGLEIVAIAVSTERPERVEQLATELDLRFPIAIDAPAENTAGKTFRSFRLNTTPATLLVDPDGKLHYVDRGKLVTMIQSLLKEAGAEDLPPLDVQNRPYIPQHAVRDIAEVWREMVRCAPATGVISGRVTDGHAALAPVEAVGKLRLLILSTPSPKQTVTTPFNAENDFRAASNADGTYRLTGLPKGIYEVTFAAPGKARVSRQVIIKPDLSPESLDIVLDQDDGISGRVVDDIGQAVAGAKLSPAKWHFDRQDLLSYKSGSLPVDEATTNEQGAFSLHGLYQGAWSFYVTADGFEKGELAMVAPGSADVVVTLKRAKTTAP